MKWFERHLNWTLVLACLAVGVVVGVLEHEAHGCSHSAGLRHSMMWVALPVAYLLPLVPCAWVLRKKSQSLWWVAAVFGTAVAGGHAAPYVLDYYCVAACPVVGAAIPLALANRTGVASSSREKWWHFGGRIVGVILSGFGVFGVAWGVIGVAWENADPGHGALQIGCCALAGGIVVLVCAAGLLWKARDRSGESGDR